MNLQEAEQKLKVTDEEVASIRRYLGFDHTSINLLSDLDPKAFCKLNKEGWLLAENEEDLKTKINEFVNIYSAMYKNSKEDDARRGLIRGTSIDGARALSGTTSQFLSTSTREDIAKRFCEYGNAALIRISIGEGVPHLYSEEYRDAGVNEHEIIIAPFCKIIENELLSEWNGYKYYSVSIAKGELQEKSKEEIESLTTQVIDGYSQNIEDMKEYVWIKDKIESLQDRLLSTRDMKDRKYISEELDNLRKQDYTLLEKTITYKNNLTGLLQGLCREREKEIDNARDIVKKDKEQKEKEANRKKAITNLSQRLENAVKNIGTINSNVVNTYEQLVNNEEKYIQVAHEFGINTNSSVEYSLGKDIEAVIALIGENKEELQQIQVREDSSIEDANKNLQENTGRFNNIGYSMQISENLGEILDLYREQSIDTLKRNIYLRMNRLMSDEKVKLLEQQKANIQQQKVGIFDKITGKSKVRELQINNIDLEMKLISKNTPEEKEYYSARDMLAEMYAFSTTELGGNFTPELGKLFNTMQDKFKDKNGSDFSLDYIRKLAEPKIEERRNLPAVPKKGFRLFGKTKDQIEVLQAQNSRLQTRFSSNENKFRSELERSAKQSAVELFKQRLGDISYNLNENSQRRQVQRDNNIEQNK